jgi:hypothetical protein
MSVLWSYFWPVFGIGLLLGLVAGLRAFRRPQPAGLLAIGAAIAIAAAALWHGPLGGADRFAGQVDRTARQALDYYEMAKVSARLDRAPLTRRLTLAGPADEFQHDELTRLMNQLPGVSRASWTGGGGVPLIVEGGAVSLAGFLIGMLLAYLVDLRRRYNAQWNW